MEGLLSFALEQVEHLGVLCIDRNEIKYANSTFCSWLEVNKESIIDKSVGSLHIKIQSSNEDFGSYLAQLQINTKVSVVVTSNHNYRVEVSMKSASSAVCLFQKIYKKGKHRWLIKAQFV
jgi:hypothetical protein